MSIDKTLYESADVDGATWFQKFMHITVPQTKSIIEFYVIITLIEMLSWVFNFIYVMTAGGIAAILIVISDCYEKRSERMKRKRGGIVQLLMILLVRYYLSVIFYDRNSFKTHEEYVNNMAGLPQTFTVQNFVEAFRGTFGQWFMNSLIMLTVAAVFITGIIALLAGYAFCKDEV